MVMGLTPSPQPLPPSKIYIVFFELFYRIIKIKFGLDEVKVDFKGPRYKTFSIKSVQLTKPDKLFHLCLIFTGKLGA
jgi:hypothetical protein